MTLAVGAPDSASVITFGDLGRDGLLVKPKQEQGGKFGKRTVQMILDHFNTNKDFYNISLDTPELTSKKLRTWMRSNGWKKSHFKEGEVRSSPRKKARKDTLSSGLPLGDADADADDDDDDDDDDEEDSDDGEETATQVQPGAATGA